MMADARVTMAVADGVADVRCVVPSGEGRAFCAGLGTASMAAGAEQAALPVSAEQREAVRANLEKRAPMGGGAA